MNHPILFDMTCDGKDRYYTPRQIINALHDAGEEMNYSNYHNSQFLRAEKIIRQWCKDNNIPLGPTDATIEKKKNAKHEKIISDLKSGNPKLINKALGKI